MYKSRRVHATEVRTASPPQWSEPGPERLVLEEALRLRGGLERVEPLEHGASRPSNLCLEPAQALD